MFSSIIGIVNELLSGLSNGFKKNFFNYNVLETAMDSYTIVARDGSLLTVLSIDGIRDIISPTNYYYNIIAKLSSSLSSSMEKSGHVIQSCFHYNPMKSEELIDNYLKPAYETCSRLNLNLEYMLDSQKENYKSSASEEKNFFLIWTTTAVLSKEETKKSHKNKVEEFKNANLPVGNSGNPFVAHEAIYERHKSMVSNVLGELQQVGLVVYKMSVVDAIREIRMGIDEEYTGEEWTPYLPGDRLLPNQMKQHPKAEEYDVFPHKLSQQICNKDAFFVDNKLLKVGNVYYAPIYIDLMPKDIDFFYGLFKKLISYQMPWRILYTISGDGLASIAMKHTLSQILSFSSKSNKLFNESADALKALTMNNGTVVKFQIALCTWAYTKEQALEQVAKLSRATESWGSCNVSEVTGNPAMGLASASMGFSPSGVATVSVAPLEDAITMLPLSRPSAIWDSGAVILKSPDGKLLPYQPMSSVQITWITLIFAGPGSGKSVFNNLTNIALCLSPGIERLPLISIIDIGPSSKGFIELMIDALPANQKHYAMYSRIENTSKYTMNPFDLKVCCRFPFAIEKQYIVNLITLIMTDPGANVPPEGISAFVNDTVEETYKYFSDSPSVSNRAPKKYNRYVVDLVDQALDKIGVPLVVENDDVETDLPATTWFEVADILMKNGMIHEATMATRHAVPILSDLTMIARTSNKIKDLYGKLMIGNSGEDIFSAFDRMISSAIAAYPILAGVTSYDLGEARIISLDLDQVAKTGSLQADRQTSIMYMYAIKLTTSDFFLDRGNLDELPFPKGYEAPSYTDVEMCKAYHLKRFDDIKDDKKRLSIDEFHRTSKSQTVRDQVLVYMREGRKWGVEIILASQSIDDFDNNMIEFATTTLVLSAGKSSTVDKIVQRLGVNDEAEIDVLRNRIRPPTRENGNVFMAKFTTKKGDITQLLNNKMGPVQIWALSTTVNDVKVRELMFNAVGREHGRRILADAFPYGTAEMEVEDRIKNKNEFTSLSVHEQIVQEQINRYGPKYGIAKNQRFF